MRDKPPISLVRKGGRCDQSSPALAVNGTAGQQHEGYMQIVGVAFREAQRSVNPLRDGRNKDICTRFWDPCGGSELEKCWLGPTAACPSLGWRVAVSGCQQR